MAPPARAPASSASRLTLAITLASVAVVLLVMDRVAAAGWTAAGGLAAALGVRACGPLFRTPEGAPLASPGLANALTLARFVWIAPVCALLAEGAWMSALGAYALLALSDVADGIVARIRHETSVFGIVMDPLADVLSTFAVFTVFRVDNLVPLWLYLLLAGRYAMLLAGSAVLTLAVGPIAYRATVPGKVVGVVQGVGVVLIVWGAQGGGLEPGRARVVFAVLGLGFASIVVSQGLIGWRHIRNTTRGRTAQRGSSR